MIIVASVIVAAAVVATVATAVIVVARVATVVKIVVEKHGCNPPKFM